MLLSSLAAGVGAGGLDGPDVVTPAVVAGVVFLPSVREAIMNLPFSHDEFLDVFGAYNSALWPVAAVLWLVTAGLAVKWMRRGTMNQRWLYGLLAVHWAWSGIAYLWFFFREINPAAYRSSGCRVQQHS